LDPVILHPPVAWVHILGYQNSLLASLWDHSQVQQIPSSVFPASSLSLSRLWHEILEL
jgi:hypothetical protein